MNIALGAVLIFILLIPPLAFYITYNFGREAKPGPKFSLLETILASAVLSLFVHAIALMFIQKEIRFDVLIKLAGGELKDISATVPNKEFKHLVLQFALYNLIIVILFIALGRFARWFSMHYGWDDGRSEMFRLHSRWYYFFNGLESNIDHFDLLYIDAVMDTKDGTMIYSGFLVEYICEGETLDRILIKDAVRREFKTPKDGTTVLQNLPGQPMSIPGHLFSIPYKNCINLNLSFIVLEDEIGDIEQMPVQGAIEEIPLDAADLIG